MITLPVVLLIGLLLATAAYGAGVGLTQGNRAVASGLAATALLATAVVAIGHFYPRYGADRISHMIDWGRDCNGLVSHKSPWGGSSRVHVTQVECNYFDSPAIRYSKFPAGEPIDPDVAGALNLSYCVAGREVVVDLLEEDLTKPGREFTRLCGRLNGVLRKGHHPPPA